MMSQQPAVFRQGANSYRYRTYLEDKKIVFVFSRALFLLEGPFIFVYWQKTRPN